MTKLSGCCASYQCSQSEFATFSDQPIHPGTRSFVYADDLAVATQSTDFAPIEETLTSALEGLTEYYTTNQLRANPTKTQVSLFHLRNRDCGKQLNISWNGVNLTHCNLPVYLGVTLYRTLSYKAHIEKTKKKVGTRNNIIRKLRNSKWGATPTTLRSSALALCYSAAEYACPVWERSTHAKKLDATLNETCRMITGCLKPTNTKSAHTRRNRPVRHQESGGKSYGTDPANYGRKAPTQWTSRSGGTPEITEKLHQKH